MKIKRALTILIAMSLVHPLGWSAEMTPIDPSVGSETTPSLVSEAAGATVGRVFGVEGDAGEIQYHEIEFTRHSPVASATRSLLVPGWGQYFNRQRTKGTIFFVTTVGAAFASAQVYSKARDSYDSYKATGVRDDSHYDDYRRGRKNALILGGTAVLIWAVSIVDAYRNAYKPLYSQVPTVDVALLPEGGAELRLQKGF